MCTNFQSATECEYVSRTWRNAWRCGTRNVYSGSTTGHTCVQSHIQRTSIFSTVGETHVLYGPTTMHEHLVEHRGMCRYRTYNYLIPGHIHLTYNVHTSYRAHLSPCTPPPLAYPSITRCLDGRILKYYTFSLRIFSTLTYQQLHL